MEYPRLSRPHLGWRYNFLTMGMNMNKSFFDAATPLLSRRNDFAGF